MFRKKTTLKRHITSVKHPLEEKRMQTETENLQQITTLWSTTDPEVRCLSHIDHIDQECCAQDPTCKFSIFPLNTLKEKPVTNPLEDKGKKQYPRSGHGM